MRVRFVFLLQFFRNFSTISNISLHSIDYNDYIDNQDYYQKIRHLENSLDPDSVSSTNPYLPPLLNPNISSARRDWFLENYNSETFNFYQNSYIKQVYYEPPSSKIKQAQFINFLNELLNHENIGQHDSDNQFKFNFNQGTNFLKLNKKKTRFLPVNIDATFTKINENLLYFDGDSSFDENTSNSERSTKTEPEKYIVTGLAFPSIESKIKYIFYTLAQIYAWTSFNYSQVIILTGKFKNWNRYDITRFLLARLLDLSSKSNPKFNVKIFLLNTNQTRQNIGASQISRLFVAGFGQKNQIFQDFDILLTNDVDLFPIESKFFHNLADRVIRQEGKIFSTMRLSPTNPNNFYTYLGMSGIGATVETWRELVGFEQCRSNLELLYKPDVPCNEEGESARIFYKRGNQGQLSVGNLDTDVGLTRRYDLMNCTAKCPVDKFWPSSEMPQNYFEIQNYITNIFGHKISTSKSERWTTQWFLDQYLASILVGKYAQRNGDKFEDSVIAVWRSNYEDLKSDIKHRDQPYLRSYARMQRGKNWNMDLVLNNFDPKSKSYTFVDTHMPGILPFTPKEWWHTIQYYSKFLLPGFLDMLSTDRDLFLLAFHRSPNVCVEDYDNFQKWLVKIDKVFSSNPFLDPSSKLI